MFHFYFSCFPSTYPVTSEQTHTDSIPSPLGALGLRPSVSDNKNDVEVKKMFSDAEPHVPFHCDDDNASPMDTEGNSILSSDRETGATGNDSDIDSDDQLGCSSDSSQSPLRVIKSGQDNRNLVIKFARVGGRNIITSDTDSETERDMTQDSVSAIGGDAVVSTNLSKDTTTDCDKTFPETACTSETLHDSETVCETNATCETNAACESKCDLVVGSEHIKAASPSGESITAAKSPPQKTVSPLPEGAQSSPIQHSPLAESSSLRAELANGSICPQPIQAANLSVLPKAHSPQTPEVRLPPMSSSPALSVPISLKDHSPHPMSEVSCQPLDETTAPQTPLQPSPKVHSPQESTQLPSTVIQDPTDEESESIMDCESSSSTSIIEHLTSDIALKNEKSVDCLDKQEVLPKDDHQEQSPSALTSLCRPSQVSPYHAIADSPIANRSFESGSQIMCPFVANSPTNDVPVDTIIESSTSETPQVTDSDQESSQARLGVITASTIDDTKSTVPDQSVDEQLDKSEGFSDLGFTQLDGAADEKDPVSSEETKLNVTNSNNSCDTQRTRAVSMSKEPADQKLLCLVPYADDSPDSSGDSEDDLKPDVSPKIIDNIDNTSANEDMQNNSSENTLSVHDTSRTGQSTTVESTSLKSNIIEPNKQSTENEKSNGDQCTDDKIVPRAALTSEVEMVCNDLKVSCEVKTSHVEIKSPLETEKENAHQSAEADVFNIEQISKTQIPNMEQSVGVEMETEVQPASIEMKISKPVANSETESKEHDTCSDIESMQHSVQKEIVADKQSANSDIVTKDHTADSEVETKEYSADSEMETKEHPADCEMETKECSPDFEMETKEHSADREIETTECSACSEVEAKEHSVDSEMETKERSADSEIETKERAADSEIETKERAADSEVENKEHSAKSEMKNEEHAANSDVETKEHSADYEFESKEHAADSEMETQELAAEVRSTEPCIINDLKSEEFTTNDDNKNVEDSTLLLSSDLQREDSLRNTFNDTEPNAVDGIAAHSNSTETTECSSLGSLTTAAAVQNDDMGFRKIDDQHDNQDNVTPEQPPIKTKDCVSESCVQSVGERAECQRSTGLQCPTTDSSMPSFDVSNVTSTGDDSAILPIGTSPGKDADHASTAVETETLQIVNCVHTTTAILSSSSDDAQVHTPTEALSSHESADSRETCDQVPTTDDTNDVISQSTVSVENTSIETGTCMADVKEVLTSDSQLPSDGVMDTHPVTSVSFQERDVQKQLTPDVASTVDSGSKREDMEIDPITTNAAGPASSKDASTSHGDGVEDVKAKHGSNLFENLMDLGSMVYDKESHKMESFIMETTDHGTAQEAESKNEHIDDSHQNRSAVKTENSVGRLPLKMAIKQELAASRNISKLSTGKVDDMKEVRVKLERLSNNCIKENCATKQELDNSTTMGLYANDMKEKPTQDTDESKDMDGLKGAGQIVDDVNPMDCASDKPNSDAASIFTDEGGTKNSCSDIEMESDSEMADDSPADSGSEVDEADKGLYLFHSLLFRCIQMIPSS